MTKPSTAPAIDRRPLSEVARHVVAPDGIASTAWPKVRDTCARLGWEFDGWQDGAGRLILSKRSDGTYAADTIVISIPRQVGKTYLAACVIFALCLLEPGLTVIWTAHRKTTAAETFRQFDGMSQRTRVAGHVRQVLRGKGDEKIIFKNGSRILFGARESGFGRGMTDIDILVLDEGQILPESTLEDMGATQNVAKNPLTFVMGTPPRPRDNGEFFTLLRQEALDGESDGTLYIETSADIDADPMDRSQWRKANPSYPGRTTERAMLRLRKKLKSAESWNREALGIWDYTATNAVIRPADWAGCQGEHDSSIPLGAVGIAATLDLKNATITAAAAVDGDVVQVRPLHRAPGTAWIVEKAKALQDATDCEVVIDSRGPGAVLIPHLELAGVRVTTMTTSDVLDACAGFDTAVRERRIRHAGYAELDAAVLAAVARAVGDRWAWGRKASAADITPLEGATFATWLLSRPPEPVAASAYEDRGVLTV